MPIDNELDWIAWYVGGGEMERASRGRQGGAESCGFARARWMCRFGWMDAGRPGRNCAGGGRGVDAP